MLDVFNFYILFNIEIYLQSQTSSPENPFGKSNMDDFDFVDVEGDMETDVDRNSKKKDVLEEGKAVILYIINFVSIGVFNNLFIFLSQISNSPVKTSSMKFHSARTNIPSKTKRKCWN